MNFIFSLAARHWRVLFARTRSSRSSFGPTFVLYIIWLMTSFAVPGIWLNNTLPTLLPLLKAVLVQYLLFSIAFKAFVALVSVVCTSTNWCPLSGIFNFGNSQELQGAIGTVWRLMKLHNITFCQILLYEVRYMCWCIIVVKQPQSQLAHCSKLWLSSYYWIMQSFHNLETIFPTDCLTFKSILLVHKTLILKKKISTDLTSLRLWCSFFDCVEGACFHCEDWCLFSGS